MILNFFTAYYDQDDNLVITKKEIIHHYLRTWFIIDIIAILPFNYILDAQQKYQSLGRIARLPRLYRLLKIAKVARIFRFMAHEILTGMEKLITFLLILLIICHLIACGWYFLAKLDGFTPDCWVVRFGMLNSSEVELYITCFHFAFTMITTIGDSGIKAEGNCERLFYIVAMFIGVCSYSFALSSLTSFIQALDSKHAKLKEQLARLEDLKSQYGIDYNTYIKMKKAVKYDIARNETDNIEFVNELPQPLRIELSVIMNQKLINKIPFLQNRPYHFISFLSPLLKRILVHKGEYIYKEGDSINEIYFLLSGKASFALDDYYDLAYINIEEGYYFGDTCLFCQNEDCTRTVSVKAEEDCELIVLTKEDLFNIDLEYPEILSDMVKSAQKRSRYTMAIKQKAILFCQTLPKIPSSDCDSDNKKINHLKSKKELMETQFTEHSEIHSSLRQIEEEDSITDNSNTDQNKEILHTSARSLIRSPKKERSSSSVLQFKVQSAKDQFKMRVIPKAKMKSINILQHIRDKHLSPEPSRPCSINPSSEEEESIYQNSSQRESENFNRYVKKMEGSHVNQTKKSQNIRKENTLEILESMLSENENTESNLK